jgi:hypothetical protein
MQVALTESANDTLADVAAALAIIVGCVLVLPVLLSLVCCVQSARASCSALWTVSSAPVRASLSVGRGMRGAMQSDTIGALP